MNRLQKIYLMCFTIIFLSSGIAYASYSGSSPTWTCEPDSASVSSCIAAASAGDIINVTAGDGRENWGANAITIPANKALSIMGPGKDNLTITLTGSNVITINGSASRISGFTFESPSETKRTAIIAKGKGWRVDHCKYNSIATTGGTGLFVWANDLNVDYGPTTGLIDNNEIINGKVAVNGGSSFAEMGEIFATPLGLGTDEAVYIEDNTFTSNLNPATLKSLAVDANWAGSYVFRYNTLVQCDVLAHGLQLYNTRGTRKWEIYGNTFESLGAGTWSMINVKAGTGVIFYNQEIASENPYNVYLYLMHERDHDFDNAGVWDDCDGTENCDGNKTGGNGWVCRDQVGAGTDAIAWTNAAEDGPAQASTPAYFWTNKTGAGTWMPVYNPIATHMQENRDFYTYNPSFDGTSGTGVGTLADRPETCRVGVAYWATDQNTTDLTGMVGANPVNPISGTLYKCTSTNVWTKYYTPYTYPHPLRGESEYPIPPPNWPREIYQSSSN